jgi:hypothetical protein
MFFWIFEILVSSRDFNKLVIKAKMHAKLFFLYEDTIWFFIYIFFRETWPYAWKQNILFYLFIFFENQVFNTEFVSLQYKNTNQYWSKCSEIFAENHRFLKRIFLNFFEFFWLGPTRPMWLGWTQPTCVAGLDSASPAWSLAQSQWPNYAMHV